MKKRTTTSETSYEHRGGSPFHYLVILCLAALIVASVNSCTSRKAEKQRQTEVYKTEIRVDETISEKKDINVKLETVEEVDDQSETEKTVKMWSPIDPTLPSSMTDPDGKKRDFTNSSYKEETTREKKNTKNKGTAKAEITEKQEVIKELAKLQKGNANKSAETINITKKGISFGIWVWVTIAVIGIAALLYLNQRFSLVKRVTAFFSK
jgi:hypothetical protein